jgi:hypothetical protein
MPGLGDSPITMARLVDLNLHAYFGHALERVAMQSAGRLSDLRPATVPASLEGSNKSVVRA